MKVKDLIERLNQYDPEAEAVVRISGAKNPYLEIAFTSAPTTTPYRNEVAVIARANS